ncbi:MAG: extracellular solute-binding protein [Syntrophobacteraceae bacterium]
MDACIEFVCVLAATVVVLVIAQFVAFPSEVFGGRQRFDGVEIKVGVMSAPAIGNPAKAHAKTWEQVTGGKVTIVEYPFNELFDRFHEAVTAAEGPMDVIFYASPWAGDFFPYLSEVPKPFTADESFEDILPVYLDRLMKWEGKLVSVTVDGDLYFGYYRKDLFLDAENRSEFKASYGYDLAPPDTWSQYRDIAEFFKGRKAPDGTILSGTTEPFAPGTQQFWTVFSRAAAYTNPPDNPGTQFFDPDTMKAQVNNEGWRRAVQDYVDIQLFCPEGSRQFGILDTREAFVQGKAAMILDWGDTGQLAVDLAKSAIVGKVGYFMLPGADQVWNSRNGSWEKLKRPRKISFLAFGGWVGAVPLNSRQKEAAWDFIFWYGNPENSLHDVVMSDTGINPYRYSHFTSIDTWTRSFQRDSAAQYLEVIRLSLESHDVALDLRLPAFNEYTTVFEKEVFKAVNGEVPVSQALDRAAAGWEAITDRMGREKQRSIYRSSMGLSAR